MLMDSMNVDAKTGKPQGQGNKIDDVYQQYGSAYFYQSEYLKNHMYMKGGPHLSGGYTSPGKSFTTSVQDKEFI